MFDQFQSKFVDSDGIKTHYVEMGDGDPLILVHGGGAGADGRQIRSGLWLGQVHRAGPLTRHHLGQESLLQLANLVEPQIAE